jgi:hypothetical protein
MVKPTYISKSSVRYTYYYTNSRPRSPANPRPEPTTILPNPLNYPRNTSRTPSGPHRPPPTAHTTQPPHTPHHHQPISLAFSFTGVACASHHRSTLSQFRCAWLCRLLTSSHYNRGRFRAGRKMLPGGISQPRFRHSGLWKFCRETKTRD